MPRHSKTLTFAVRFANFAQINKIDTLDLANLISLAKASKAAYERGNHTAEQKRGEEFEALAMKCGFKTDWPGLWPTLSKDGKDHYLPCD